MSDAQAGTPAATPDDGKAGTQGQQGGDGSGNDAQKWEEALKWKQKAEDYNKLQKEAESLRATLAAQQMLATANRATDPMAELRSTLAAQAEYDPASKAALLALHQQDQMAAELWLSDATAGITPDAKRERVKVLIRNSGYQMSVDYALSTLTDPEAKTLAEKLAEAEKTIERLKNAKPNGVSPSSTVPASSGEGSEGASPSEIKRSEYVERLKLGGPEARALMAAVGSNKTKLVDD